MKNYSGVQKGTIKGRDRAMQSSSSLRFLFDWFYIKMPITWYSSAKVCCIAGRCETACKLNFCMQSNKDRDDLSRNLFFNALSDFFVSLKQILIY